MEHDNGVSNIIVYALIILQNSDVLIKIPLSKLVFVMFANEHVKPCNVFSSVQLKEMCVLNSNYTALSSS